MKRWAILLVLCAAGNAHAGNGRLLATGGVMPVEGGAGGGISPWAVIAGYGTEDEAGATLGYTRVDTGDYTLDVIGAAYGWRDRVEVSFAQQDLDLGTLGILLSEPDAVLRQNIAGLKVKVYGDAIYGPAPQFAVGIQHKTLIDPAIPLAVGARDDSGTDFYVAVTHVALAGFGGRNLLLNGVVRSTEANQGGLLGFGGPDGGRTLVFEGSAVVLLDRDVALGLEYRGKPDNLAFAREDDWRDLFIAWFPSKDIALVVAYADLGSVATLRHQTGFYLNATVTF
jgi:hypothetical protein